MLRQITVTDPGLRAEVESLLKAAEDAAGFLEEGSLDSHLKELTEAEDSVPSRRSVGPYEILSKLGEGGMGIVYLARDTRLGRRAALKVLPPEYAQDGRRLSRFAREAKAASSLNHPNIITIYEIGESGGQPYLAAEYVEGLTFRQLLSQGPPALPDTLKLILQAAGALAAAHRANVVHRDVKPENLMVRPDGIVKVLDFGLASITELQRGRDHSDTQAGMALGTPRYMSPEQARGLILDARTDIFSLGAVLYELVTGRPPCSGTTAAEVFSALLNQDPAPISGKWGRVIRKALEKDPAMRYQSMDQFVAALEGLRGITEAKVRRPRMRWILAVAGLAALGGVGLLVEREWSGPPPMTYSRRVPITTARGYKSHAAFSPDGKQIAYAWDGDDPAANGHRNLYVQSIEAGEPRRVTHSDRDESYPAWSPDGKSIAFMRSDRLYLVPASGGAERMLREPASWGISWSPDGRWIVYSEQSNGIWLIAPATGERRQLTRPAHESDVMPAVSPDGNQVAFVRHLSPSARELYLVPFQGGEAKRLTFDQRPIDGVAWTHNGRELVFASSRLGGGHSLWRIPVRGGTPWRVIASLQDAFFPAISPDGKRLVYTETYTDTNVWLFAGPGFQRNPSPGAVARSRSLINSSRGDHSPAFSPDGQRVVFVSERTGDPEIYVCNRDGSQVHQITEMKAASTGTPRWSPDGHWIVFDSNAAGRPNLYLVSPSGGTPKRVELGEPARLPSWSSDGKSFYYYVNRGDGGKIYRAPLTGGRGVAVTAGRGYEGYESADGTMFYFTRSVGGRGIWSVPVAGGPEKIVPGLENAGYWRSWGVTKQGIYFITKEEGPNQTARFYSFATRRLTALASVDKTPVWQFPTLALSPDGKSMLYAQLDNQVDDLVLVENFH